MAKAKKGEKREYPTKPCADCGQPAKMANKATRYCGACRLGRQAAWHDGRRQKCATCDRQFIAWSGAKQPGKGGDVSCGFCLIERMPLGGREAVLDECAYHAQGRCLSGDPPHVVAHGRVQICYPCLHDPEKYEDNKRALVKARRKRLTDGQKSSTVERKP